MDWLAQLMFSLEYLHASNLSHRDITVHIMMHGDDDASTMTDKTRKYLLNATHAALKSGWMNIPSPLFQPRNIFISQRSKILKLGAPDVSGKKKTFANVFWSVSAHTRSLDFNFVLMRGKGMLLFD